MKKYLAYAAVLGLAMSVNTALPSATLAQESPRNDGIIHFCKMIVNDFGGTWHFQGFPFPSHFDNLGDCLQMVRTEFPAPAHFCAVLDSQGIMDILFESFGDCVNRTNTNN